MTTTTQQQQEHIQSSGIRGGGVNPDLKGIADSYLFAAMLAASQPQDLVDILSGLRAQLELMNAAVESGGNVQAPAQSCRCCGEARPGS